LAAFIEARGSLWAAGNLDARLSGSRGFEPARADRGDPRHGCISEFMQTEAAADAMKADGVRPETLLVLDEG
jgi:hypothetical protein